MRFSLQRWISISLFNLVIVAFIGIILRYKIVFSLPFLDQKHLLHGHSHFAFYGWITQVLMVLLVAYLAARTKLDILKKYRWILFANLVTAYGMLIAFSMQGYGVFSIMFSTLSVLVSYAFTIMYWRDLNKLQTRNVSHLWFKGALLFNAVSTLGVFALAGMMITKIMNQHAYLAAEYFYLHFQYNGWFFFACMGLFTELISRFTLPGAAFKKIFWLFAFAAVPAYFLSTLWMPLPLWIYILVVIAAFAQLAGWIWLVAILKSKWLLLKDNISPTAKRMLVLSSLALTTKLLLQTGSVIPSLSNLAFGFRPIVIGYLHLVLLGVITLFVLGYLFAEKYFYINKMAAAGAIVFAGAVILNEVFLMAQGVAAITYTVIPFINQILLGSALLLFSGALLIASSKKNILQK